MADMIKFFKGLEASLPASGVNGALYITTDEGAIYLGTGTGMKRLGDFIQVANVAALPAKAHESCLYYCVAENILAKWNGTEWKQINKQPTAEELKGLLGLGSLAYKSIVAEADLDSALKDKVNAAAEGNHSHSNKALLDTYTQTEADLADAVAKKHSHSFADEAALNGITAAKVADWDDAVSKEHTHTFADTDVEDAISKKHSHTFVESELNKIAAGDVAKWNGVVADHLTSADKTAIEDSIGDVNTALEDYKTSNNEALAGVKATAEAAATKEYTDAELAKKVAKTDYEADKATFATKTELSGVDAKFASYKTAADQKLIDDAQDAEIAKKVDKVEGKSLVDDAEITKLAGVSEGANKVEASTNGKIKIDGVDTVVYTHPDKHTVSEISDFETKIASYDYATKAEAQAMADGKDGAIAAALKAGTDAQADVDVLEKYVGTIPADYTETNVISYINKKAEETLAAAQGGSSETAASVKQQLDNYKSENDTRVKAAEDAIDAVEGRMDTAEGKITALEGASATHAVKSEVEAALALKADKSALEATDKTLADVKTVVDNFFAEDAAVNDTIDTLKEIANYIATDKEGAADITARVGALEGKVDVDKVSEAIDADVNAAIEAEVLRADGAYDKKGDAVAAQAAAELTASNALASARTEITTEIGTAKSGAEAKAAELDAALKTELQGEIDADVKVVNDALEGYKTSNDAAVALKANAADVYGKSETFTKEEVAAAIEAAITQAHTWGSF